MTNSPLVEAWIAKNSSNKENINIRPLRSITNGKSHLPKNSKKKRVSLSNKNARRYAKEYNSKLNGMISLLFLLGIYYTNSKLYRNSFYKAENHSMLPLMSSISSKKPLIHINKI